jgi:DNA-binding response OmpR family regulator
MVIYYTPTEERILRVLSDGLPHSHDDLRELLCDDMAVKRTINTHVSNIRRKLKPLGQTIVCEYIRKRQHYRHIVLLNQ